MKKKRLSFRFFVILAVLAFALVGVMISPLFRVAEIEIYGNAVLTEAEILAAFELETGVNIFAFSTTRAAERVNALPYSRFVTVSRQLPDKITITMQEREPAANIRLGAAYLLIDNAGMVLSTGQSPIRGLPIVTGINFANFAIGQYLQVEQNAVFGNILYLSRYFALYELNPDIVDFTNPRDIIMRAGNVEIDFGNMEDAPRKVRYLRAILDDLPEMGFDMGFIDIKDISNNQPRFRLTR
ncbi:MAG: FtsQ-type POTRA domain-containing protein [Clostridiales bacterium]|jgi:cell division protein FtsQ|nr:FtsQ-type POTRA domain-containing protein [Clostridiales bacterium]